MPSLTAATNVSTFPKVCLKKKLMVDWEMRVVRYNMAKHRLLHFLIGAVQKAIVAAAGPSVVQECKGIGECFVKFNCCGEITPY